MKYQYYLQEPSFRVNNIDVQSVSRPQNYKYSVRNGREKYGFVYISSGKMQYAFQNSETAELFAEQGELVFIPKGCLYTGIYLGESTAIRIIQFDLISGELPAYLARPAKLCLSNARELMDSFFRKADGSLPKHPFFFLSRLYELLWRIDEASAEMPKKYKKLSPALFALTEHPEENRSVSEYAALCDMSESGFRRLFRSCTGLSPIDYRNDLRLKNAKNKLQSGEYNVSEAAYAAGFSNLSFFIRLYKKAYGHTPKKE